MADPLSPSPARRQPIRVGTQPAFLPLAEDSRLSTRGQRLPLVLQSRSLANLEEAKGLLKPTRKSAFLDHNGENQRQDDQLDGAASSLKRVQSISDQGSGKKSEDVYGSMQRRTSLGAELLQTPQMRSMRLIGNSNARYNWEQYYKTEDELKEMKKPIRQYYERNNFLISQYLYIDKLLDSTLPHNLIQEYDNPKHLSIPNTIGENAESPPASPPDLLSPTDPKAPNGNGHAHRKVKRTPRDIYHVPAEETPLLGELDPDGPKAIDIELGGMDEDLDSGHRVVTIAIYINLAANVFLLAGKIVVIVLTSSLSVLASLVDAALDFLSTAIIWTTTKLISTNDHYAYPVGRRRLEPLGVLVFSVIMITAFAQVALECIQSLSSGDHAIVELGTSAIIIMASTVVIKFACWLWCRFIKNSSVQALAQDAMTDVVFNIFSIIFPLIGFYAKIWWLDALGGLILSLYVITNWSLTSVAHIRNLTGCAASADERNVLLYLTMRFAKTITSIQGLQAYHVGDKLNVEVDVVLDEAMKLRDSHDLGESLQYVLESVPSVDRAFVHLDYDAGNLPGHLEQQQR